jgi:carboxypeptidase Q
MSLGAAQRLDLSSFLGRRSSMVRTNLRVTPLLCVAAVGLSALALPAAPQSGAEDIQSVFGRIITEERDRSEVMTNLEYLSDSIGPRLTGSDRLKRANDWTAEKMKQYGLENVHLESYTIPRGWERGAISARLVEPNGLPVALAQAAWTPGTDGPLAGPVVVMAADSEEDLAAYKGKLHGAFVLTVSKTANNNGEGALPLPDQKEPKPIPAISAVTPKPKAKPTGFGMPRNFDYKKYMAFRTKLTELMDSEVVLGTLRDAGKPYDLLNMTGSWEGNATKPTFFIAHEHVAMIQRLLLRNQPVKLEVTSTAHFVEGPLTVYNTVGEIRGAEKPNEVVLLGAHLDSWDLGTGSTDNGTGAMAVLEAAHLLKTVGAQPKRTMRFVLFSGEEEGLHGSQAYVEAHKSEMPQYDVVYVHDTGTGRVKGAWLQERPECKPMLQGQFDLLGRLGLLTDKPNLMPGKMNGTDHASFDDAGVPAFAYNQEDANYGLNHHSQADTYDKARPDDLKQGAVVLAVMGYDAAQKAERFPRKPEKRVAAH